MINDFSFRQASKNDIEEVDSLVQNAILKMKENGIEQWDELYPNKEVLEEDIQKEQMTLLVDENKIAAIYVLSEDCDEGYNDGKWKYPDSKFCVIHRLCVNPEYQNKGIAKKCVLNIENECRKNGYKTIRLDSFVENPFAAKLYEKLGYECVGKTKFRKGWFDLREHLL